MRVANATTFVLLSVICGWMSACSKGPAEIPPMAAVAATYTLSVAPPECGVVAQGAGRGGVPTIALQPNGTADVVELPACYASFSGRGPTERLSGSGKWSLLRDPDGIVGLELQVGSGGSLPPGAYYSIELRNRQPPYDLYFGVGDPDNGKWLVFKSASNNRIERTRER